MKPRFVRPLLWLVSVLGLACLGFALLASSFMIYDDEGYVLWSVRSFCEGNPLYTSVYSQYGPAFYVGYRLLHLLTGLPFDNETGRLLTLFYWLGTALAAGLITRKLTRDTTAGLVTLFLTFAFLFNNIREPFHPGSLLAFMSVLAASLGAWFLQRDNTRHFTWIIALLAAAMALVKINVGFFLFAALGAWLLANTRLTSPVFGRRECPVLVLPLVSTAAVLLLMWNKLDQTWARSVAAIFILAVTGLTARLSAERTPAFAPRDWLAGLAAAAGLTVAVLLTTISLGTPPGELLNAIIIAPLRHPGVYSFAPTIPTGSVLVAALMLALVAYAGRRTLSDRWLDALAIAQILAGLACLLLVHHPIPNFPWIRFAHALGPGMAALLVFPTNPSATPAARRAHLWIAWVFLWQTLHAYPVAGTQLTWGSCLWIPLLLIGWSNARARLAHRHGKHLGFVLLLLPALAATFATYRITEYAKVCWNYSVKLDLPGARWLRPPPDISTTFQVFQRNMIRDADMVFSYPGMLSFNIWSGKPTPTAANATHWFSLLPAEQQGAIGLRLKSAPRAMVVMHRLHLRYLYDYDFITDTPLKDLLFREFAPAIRVGEYDLWIKRGRRIHALNTYRPEGASARGWLLAPDQPVARVSLHSFVHPPVELAWTLTPGDETTAPGLAMLDAVLPAEVPREANQIRLYDSQGRILVRLLRNDTPTPDTLIPPSPPAALNAAAPPAPN